MAKPKDTPKREPYPVTREYRQAFCPVCGVSHGLKRTRYPARGEKFTPSDTSYWDWLRQTDKERVVDAHFGIIQEVGRGKGHSFRFIGYFTPDQDVDGFYPLIKERLLTALSRWLRNGWLTIEDIENAIKRDFEP